MDGRIFLKEGTVLAFPEMPCRIEAPVGMGSNAMVYVGTYPDRYQPRLRHKVLIKELFPYDREYPAVRDAQGDICYEEGAEETMRMHRQSFERGNEVHICMHGSHPGEVDFNINTFSLHRTLYSVLGFSGGRSMEQEFMQAGAKTSLAVHVKRLIGALNALEAFHTSGYLHLDISPDNILFIGEGKKERVSLIDYNSVHTLEEIRNGTLFYYSEKDGYTPVEVRLRRRSQIGFHTDLYALTAVFYRCVFGRRLSQMQMVRAEAWDASGAACLAEMPDTVVSMVKQILKKGLCSVVSRRYQDTASMRADFEELLDRIWGRGITHWALWETGRANVRRIIGANPALEYIKDAEKIYPMAACRKDGSAVTFPELMEELKSMEGSSTVLLGGGGMGKTTALLRMAYMQQKSYTGTEPAVVYVSLYGWKDSGGSYIKNRILEGLRFKPQTDSMETARHELIRLLSAGLHTKRGERPKLALLLDGLNEARGELAPLLEEIAELSKLEGVRILLTARSGLTSLPFPEITLRLLTEAEVSAVLAQNGLVPPENEELYRLLQTPLLLSVFVKTALESGRQLLSETKEELLAGYLSALLDKEVKRLPKDSPERFGMEAAVYYVLPELASLFSRRQKALSDQELLPAVRTCYNRLGKRYMASVFPQWIGHLSEIRGSRENAESWYGYMVHGILWRRMGLIIRDEQGCCRSSHQMIEEYMAAIRQSNRKRIVRKEIQSRLLAVLLGILSIAAVFRFTDVAKLREDTAEERVSYDRKKAENVFDKGVFAYASMGRQYEDISQALSYAAKEPSDKEGYEHYLKACRQNLKKDLNMAAGDVSVYTESLLATGEVMPWSKKPLDTKNFEKLAALTAERAEQYLDDMQLLERLRTDEKLWEELKEQYMTEYTELLYNDACITGVYYRLILEPELAAMKESDLQEDQLYRNLCLKSILINGRQEEATAEAAADSDSILKYQQQNSRIRKEISEYIADHIMEKM